MNYNDKVKVRVMQKIVALGEDNDNGQIDGEAYEMVLTDLTGKVAEFMQMLPNKRMEILEAFSTIAKQFPIK